MKIHTTQNLSQIREITTNNIMPKQVRLNYSDKMRLHSIPEQKDTYEEHVSFRGKKQLIKPIASELKKAASKEKKWYDKTLSRGFFDKTLDLMKHEVFVQSAISCLVCVVARPLTIMALPSGKDKKDNMYAASHSVSSGIVGLMSSLLIAIPFSKGAKYMQKNMIKNLKESVLKEVYPNLDLKSIYTDATKTTRKEVENWLDVEGNQFSTDFKNVLKVAKPKHVSLVSEETLKLLGADVDVKAMEGKSVNDWVDRNGKKLHLELKDMFIKVKEEGVESKSNGKYFSLQHIDKDFLKEVMPELDIKSIENAKGERVHADHWKNVDGSPFKLDMDAIHVSSFNESIDVIPLYTGRLRNPKAKEPKYASYQTNNGILDSSRVPDKLGSEIKQEWLDADKSNDIAFKLITWFPDIVTRPIVAAGTIALIPSILKNVFHLEKNKKQEPPKEPVKAQGKEVA